MKFLQFESHKTDLGAQDKTCGDCGVKNVKRFIKLGGLIKYNPRSPEN